MATAPRKCPVIVLGNAAFPAKNGLTNSALGEGKPPKKRGLFRFRRKKGLVFAVNGARRPDPHPPPPPTPRPPPWGRGGFTENPGGGGGLAGEGGGGRARGVYGGIWGGGGQGAPRPHFTAKTSPFFGENALKLCFSSQLRIPF